MDKATAPLDLLRELRAGFEAEAGAFREQQRKLVAAGLGRSGKEQSCGAKAFAAESAVKRIDATLRDWG